MVKKERIRKACENDMDQASISGLLLRDADITFAGVKRELFETNKIDKLNLKKTVLRTSEIPLWNVLANMENEELI